MRKDQVEGMNSATPPLPRLAFIADGFATRLAVGTCAEAAVAAGLRWVHLRDHAAPEDAFAEAAHVLARRLRRARGTGQHVRHTVNTRLGAARALGSGLHVGRRGPTVEEARRRLGEGALLGFSAHGRAGATCAAAAGADYLFFSPVYPTRSKPGHPGRGVEALRAVCAAAGQAPVFALGGVTPARAATCRAAGAYGVAVLSGILRADDPTAATRAYLDALEGAENPTSKNQNPK